MGKNLVIERNRLYEKDRLLLEDCLLMIIIELLQQKLMSRCYIIVKSLEEEKTENFDCELGGCESFGGKESCHRCVINRLPLRRLRSDGDIVMN